MIMFDAMLRIMTQDTPNDFVVATGQKHTVEDFVRLSFEYVVWIGPNMLLKINGLCVQQKCLHYVGMHQKQKNLLDWSPTIPFNDLIETNGRRNSSL